MHPLEKLSRTLIDAEENGQDSKTMAFLEEVLTPDFSITRAKGNVQDKKDYIAQVVNSKPAGRCAKHHEMVREYNHCCGIVSFAVTVPEGQAAGDYRNVQVFVRNENGWKCASWQVTKMETAA